MNLKRKLVRLEDILRKMRSVIVAFSAGVDSSLLLKVAKDALGENVIAVTAKSEVYPKDDLQSAKDIARKLKAKHIILETNELKNKKFTANPSNRCYYCKKELFSKLEGLRKRFGFNFAIDGSSKSDELDYRPGTRAKIEFGVRSPLKEAGLNKNDIRRLLKQSGFSIHDKPATVCLASRFPYHSYINKMDLANIEKAETFLKGLGFDEVRLRHYNLNGSGRLARIEVEKGKIKDFINQQNRITKKIKSLGYDYITLDLEGYRQGSMNAILGKKIKI